MNIEEAKLNSGENVETTTTKVEQPTDKKMEEQSKQFTQEEVNSFVSGRLNKIYSSYGVDKKEQLDSIVEKGKKFDEIATENLKLKKQILFNEKNIDKNREQDVEIYFKGSGQELNAENLDKALETHKEWKKATIDTNFGTAKAKSSEDEFEKAIRKAWGI